MTGFTVDDVNAMQDEMNKIDLGEGEDKDNKDDQTKIDPKNDVDDANTDVDATKNNVDDKKNEDKVGVDDVNVVRELKEQLRVSNESLQRMTTEHQKLHKVLVDKGLITEDELKAEKESADALKAAHNARQEKLIDMVAVMEVNPAYADIREVCTQSNMDDVIDAFARYWSKETGDPLQDTITKLTNEIWAEPNPYKKLYEVIKQYHPKYVKTPSVDDKTKKDGNKNDGDAQKDKKVKPVDAQPSAAGIGTGGTGTGTTGWTAEKIDALDEDELNTVPKDVYSKYLAGTLK